MNRELHPLAEEIAGTLRGLIRVPPIYRGSLIASGSLWPRCRRIETDAGYKIIYVDGFANKCYRNSWKVYSDALEPGITLWLGYTCSWSRWVEHAWCMLDDRIIETTVGRAIYYGAQLTEEECAQFCSYYKADSPETKDNAWIVTTVGGDRTCVPYEPWLHDESLGHERDQFGLVKDGLGR